MGIGDKMLTLSGHSIERYRHHKDMADVLFLYAKLKRELQFQLKCINV